MKELGGSLFASSFPLSKKQIQILIGCLLGKANVYKENSSYKYRMSFFHHENKKEYFEWKVKELDNFIYDFKKVDTKLGIKYLATSIVHKEMNKYLEMFYDENFNKHVPVDIANYMDSLSLFVWVNDIGKSNNGVVRLNTSAFSKRDNIRLQDMLWCCFGIRSKVCEFCCGNKDICAISINKKNSQKLFDIMAPISLDCSF